MNQSNHNAASQFTLRVIDLFEGAFPEALLLHEGQTIRPVDRIEMRQIESLRRGLFDLLRDSLAQQAVADLYSYGKIQPGVSSQVGIQTVGVGYAENYDLFLKLGFILGDRAVMWDTFVTGTVLAPPDRFDINAVLREAYRLFSLRAVVEAGGLVILPHPLQWNDHVKWTFKRVENLPGVTPNFFGLLHAKALLEDKFAIHPYCWSDNATDAQRSTIIGNDPHLTQEKLHVHKNLRDTFTHSSLAFVTDVSPAAFFDVVSSERQFRQKLVHMLHDHGGLKTDAERHNQLSTIRQTLTKGLQEYHRKLALLHAAKVGGLGITALSAALTVATNGLGLAPLLGILGGGIAAATAQLEVWKDNRDFGDNAVLVRVFSRLAAAQEKEARIRFFGAGHSA